MRTLVVLAILLVAATASADPIVNTGGSDASWGIEASAKQPITVTARVFFPFEGGFGGELLATEEQQGKILINGADIGAETELAIVVGIWHELADRRASIVVKNAGHVTRVSWKVDGYRLVIAHVHTCSPITIEVRVGRWRVRHRIDSGCFE